MQISLKFTEWLIVYFVLFFFVILEANAISKGNYSATDYFHHRAIVQLSSINPWKALTTPCGCGTPSSLFEFIAGCLYKHYRELAFPMMATINCIVNVLALFLFYLFIRKVIHSAVIRLSCFAFITFLPITVITSVAFTADAFTTPLFIIILWVAIRIFEKLYQKEEFFALMIIEGLLLSLIETFRTHYLFCILGLFFIGITFYTQKLLKKQDLMRCFLAVIAIPSCLFICFYSLCLRNQRTDFSSALENQNTSAVHWKLNNMLFNKDDLSLLDAPSFLQEKTVDEKGINYLSDPKNFYGYPALLHLAIFSDILNIYQPTQPGAHNPLHEPYEFRIRSPENQKRMNLAVHTGLVFSIIFVLSFSWLIIKFSYLMRERKLIKKDYYILIPLILVITVFICYFSTLPVLFNIYNKGLWLPRYIFPIVLCFGVFTFIGIERLFCKRMDAQAVILMISLFQSLLHISFLWVK